MKIEVTRVILPPLYLRREPGLQHQPADASHIRDLKKLLAQQPGWNDQWWNRETIVVGCRDEECTQEYCIWYSWMPQPDHTTRIVHGFDGGRFRVVWLDVLPLKEDPL